MRKTCSNCSPPLVSVEEGKEGDYNIRLLLTPCGPYTEDRLFAIKGPKRIDKE